MSFDVVCMFCLLIVFFEFCLAFCKSRLLVQKGKAVQTRDWKSVTIFKCAIMISQY